MPKTRAQIRRQERVQQKADQLALAAHLKAVATAQAEEARQASCQT